MQKYNISWHDIKAKKLAKKTLIITWSIVAMLAIYQIYIIIN